MAAMHCFPLTYFGTDPASLGSVHIFLRPWLQLSLAAFVSIPPPSILFFSWIAKFKSKFSLLIGHLRKSLKPYPAQTKARTKMCQYDFRFGFSSSITYYKGAFKLGGTVYMTTRLNSAIYLVVITQAIFCNPEIFCHFVKK